MNDLSAATMAAASPREPGNPPPGDTTLALLGTVALLIGLAVYALCRPGPTPTSAVVAVLAGSAPSLLHAFAFTLWTALALRGRPRTVWAVALAWAALESLIEAFQHPALHALLPAAVRARWAGTFDAWDLMASLLGAALAGVLAWRHATLAEDSR